jgi:hypothetical protein
MYLSASMCNYAIFQDHEVHNFSNFQILIYRGTMMAVLPLTVTLTIDHSYFAFTQHIILRTKKGLSVGRISHNPAPRNVD